MDTGTPQDQLPSNRPIKCDVCRVWCSGNISYQNHIAGRPHYIELQKMKGVEFGANGAGGNGTNDGPPAKRARKSSGQPPEEIRCEICNVSMSGKEAYEAHLNGARHMRKIKENEVAPDVSSVPHIVEVPGQGYRCSICQVDMSGKVVVLSHVKGAKHIKKINSPAPPPPPAGVEPKERLRNENFECRICHIFVNSPAVLQQHESSAKHKHRAEKAAKMAAEEAAQQAAVESARQEAKIGQDYDAWNPSDS